MNINRKIVQVKGTLKFKNYTILSYDEKKIILNYRNHKEVRVMMTDSQIIKEKDHFNFIKKLEKDNYSFYWAVEKKEKIMGGVSLVNVDHINKQAYWGFFLNPKYIGTGLGVEVEFEALRLFFENLNFQKIKGEVLKANKNSLSMQYKFLFEEEKNALLDNEFLQLELDKHRWQRMPVDFKKFKKEILLKR